MTLPFHQDIGFCFAGKKDHRLDKKYFDALIQKTQKSIDQIKHSYAEKLLPLLLLPAARDDLKDLGDVVHQYQQFDDVIVLGTGGSSLGGQALCALASIAQKQQTRVHFVDTVDPFLLQDLLKNLDLTRTGFLVISKSGGTAETVCQFLVCLDHTDHLNLPAHFTIITEDKDNALRRLAAKFSIPCLDHDPDLGGRYSSLSLVGLLPAMILGLDAVKIRQGAQASLDDLLHSSHDVPAQAAIGAAIHIGLYQHHQVSNAVFMPYVDRYRDLGDWYRQLWAESVGKNGQGTTPVPAIGPVDQHSQLQLYLDGPRDKFFTFITQNNRGTGPVVRESLSTDADIAYLSGRTMGDLLDAEQHATIQTIYHGGQAVRVFAIEQANELTTGALMMHFMLETIVAADLLGVNPFDQPAVEQGKILTRQYLIDMA